MSPETESTIEVAILMSPAWLLLIAVIVGIIVIDPAEQCEKKGGEMVGSRCISKEVILK